jgi:hypothetical protein
VDARLAARKFFFALRLIAFDFRDADFATDESSLPAVLFRRRFRFGFAIP